MDGAQDTAVRSFRDLRVWQSAYELTLTIYSLTNTFPKSEVYGIASQMRRASVSICSNIAEGFGRRTNREKDVFYAIAKGSLSELECQLLICQGVSYSTEDLTSTIMQQCTITHKMLTRLIQVNKTKGTRS